MGNSNPLCKASKFSDLIKIASKYKWLVVVVVDRQNIAQAEQYWRFLLSSHRVNKHKMVFGQGLGAERRFLPFHKI